MRRYTKLRARMRERGWSGDDLGAHLGMSAQSFSHRMSGRKSWTLDEMYIIMDTLDIPHNEMYLYFGPGGQYVEPVKPQRMRIKFTREAI